MLRDRALHQLMEDHQDHQSLNNEMEMLFIVEVCHTKRNRQVAALDLQHRKNRIKSKNRLELIKIELSLNIFDKMLSNNEQFSIFTLLDLQ